MKNVRFLILVFTVFLFVFSACDKTRVFEDYKKIDENGWHKDSLVVFEIPVKDTINYHNLFVNVRNEIKYNYSNLWLFIEIIQPGGAAVKDTFEVQLADPTGKWLGEGFSGLKTRQVEYRRNVFFPGSGNYTIKIQQGMRDEILTGIKDMGFRVEKNQL